MKVGILNVTGYAGSELARILARHREVEITCVTGRSAAGKNLGDIFPHLSSIDLQIKPELDGSLDFVFSALPHAASAVALASLVSEGIKAVDISADFRLRDVETYEKWYGVDHPCPKYIEKSVYGLTEIYREEIAQTQLVANPGCYPTASILGLAPVISEDLIESEIIVDAKSGVSGAGRELSLKTHYSEVNESVSAYGLDGHRHMPEIAQELSALGNKDVNLTFVPHLIPMVRGILATSYAFLREDAFPDSDNLNQNLYRLYQNFFREDEFVKISGTPPATKQTSGNNNCLIYPTVDIAHRRLIVVSCLDNLVKGAAGQAVQNMNVMSQFPENLGISQLAIYP